MIEPGQEEVLCGPFPKDFLISGDFAYGWEEELFRLEESNMPEMHWPEVAPARYFTLIRRSADSPYWLQIETTDVSWQNLLARHPRAKLRYVMSWDHGIRERHYLLPASLLQRGTHRPWWKRLADSLQGPFATAAGR